MGPDGLHGESLRGLSHETPAYNAELGRVVVVYTPVIPGLA